MWFVRPLFRFEPYGGKCLAQQCVQACQIGIGLDAGPNNGPAVGCLESAYILDGDGECLMLDGLERDGDKRYIGIADEVHGNMHLLCRNEPYASHCRRLAFRQPPSDDSG